MENPQHTDIQNEDYNFKYSPCMPMVAHDQDSMPMVAHDQDSMPIITIVFVQVIQHIFKLRHCLRMC